MRLPLVFSMMHPGPEPDVIFVISNPAHKVCAKGQSPKSKWNLSGLKLYLTRYCTVYPGFTLDPGKF
ncbi:hypothetical protein Y032_0141g2277 [Ancylostoma ceylanicum]|uniref:Uncharacterized protein n=1 Tax=Ancylostoma ceylanicum TaxID=53326 RepID=A0A016T3Z5_9BILA|nr:hypothetical protein Y032_0141g2277 [Ancylostoma ceylanicum]